MVTDEALNALLNDLEGAGRRTVQLTILRTWIDWAMQAWETERREREREILGKLGGG